MSNAIDAHGTLIRRNGTVIAELKDITPVGFSRNEFDVSTHNDDFDNYIAGGILRRSPLNFGVNWLPSDEATHDADTGLLQAIADKSKDLYGIYYPDGSGVLFSGLCTNVQPNAPVEGAFDAQVTIRPTGGHILF